MVAGGQWHVRASAFGTMVSRRGLEFCVVRSRIFREVRVSSFAWVGRPFWLREGEIRSFDLIGLRGRESDLPCYTPRARER